MHDMVSLQPYDKHNQTLESLVHPKDWTNPRPDGPYNLVVIGAGTAGLVCAAGAAGLGAKVALVERYLMGGDCLNVGCVPSKAVIRAGRAAAAVREAAQFGIHGLDQTTIDFAEAMSRMRKLRARIAPNDSAVRFQNKGIDVFLGKARFTGPRTIDVDGQTLRFQKACIATGARASAPPIPGLDTVSYLTNESVFSLTERPKQLGIIGAGPIGCELAQAFARLGSDVVLIEAAHGVLPREDSDAAKIVERSLRQDQVRILCCSQQTKVSPGPTGSGVRIQLVSHGEEHTLNVDQLLVSVGRVPNIDQLGLQAAGVTHDARQGVIVDDKLRTTNPRIFAAGDVCSAYKFTHAADFMARIVVQNALIPIPKARVSKLIIPRCTYTTPEVAHVGLQASDASQQGIAIDTYRLPLEEVDRAILDGETEGFFKIHTKRRSDKILGATIVAHHAGEMISEITLAMKAGIGLKTIASVIHPYPTQAEAIRRLGDAYNRTRLTPFAASLFKKWMAWTR